MLNWSHHLELWLEIVHLSSGNRCLGSSLICRPADELCPRVIAGLLAFAASSADIVTPVLLAHNDGSASSLSRNILGAPRLYQVVVVLAFQLLVDVVAHGCYIVCWGGVKRVGSCVVSWKRRGCLAVTMVEDVKRLDRQIGR